MLTDHCNAGIFTSSSPWNTATSGDLFNVMFSTDDILNDDPITSATNNTTNNLLDFDFDITNLELEIDRVKYQNDQIREETRQMNRVLSCSTSAGSVASSECSDDLLFDFDAEFDDPLLPLPEDSVHLNSSLLNLLDDCQMTDPWNNNTGGAGDAVSSNYGLMSSVLKNTSRPSTSHPHEVLCRNDNSSINKSIASSIHFRNNKKTWSGMSDDEQLTTIEELSQIISQQLELRDQLEVIGIISPQARVSPTDTEFIIDLDDLNDRKLHMVREYLRQHITVELVVNHRCNSSSSSSCSSSTASPTHKKHLKKHPKERRTQQTKEIRQRQRKEYRQLLKEKRSGLFRKEEVLSLTNCSPSDGDEVDDNLIDIE
ncbi:uncharacterized protein LOC141912833 [Tubulanus polymorphus]|uniref:uncharacterized protein LOC141912833 n=1 Tax=Tubulanus polymorphus TaxID=672921 RepID=UPI003DA2534C